MAEEFHQGGVCGGNWWNSSRNLFGCSSPCSLASNDVAGSLSWNSPDMFTETTKPRLNDHGSMLPQNVHNPSMMGISSHGWNQDFLNRDGGRSDENYSDILREPGGLDSGMNYNQHQTCEGLSAAFPLNSSLLQTLFDTDQLEQTLSDNQGTNYPDQFLQVPPVFGKQQVTNHLPLGNKNPPLWNTQVGGNFLRSSPLDTNNYDHNSPTFNTKRQNEAGKLMGKKGSNEPTVKRPRIETPSPLPTFKVRKEKLGDRITALQQLVSPFGKTDTASVLHEAIEYIKFLHDQVSALCTPYLKNGSPQALQPQQATDNDRQSHNVQDLKSGGLCLVPISSTYPVADAATDFWNPSFVGTFKL